MVAGPHLCIEQIIFIMRISIKLAANLLALSCIIWAASGCKPAAPAIDKNAAGEFCAQSLKILADGKKMWAEQNHKTADDVPAMTDLTTFIRHAPTCPAKGTYTLGKVSEEPTCSIPEHNAAYKKLISGAQ